jgi:hypothetical protein
VYKGPDDLGDGFSGPEPLSMPVLAFCHARIEHEAEVRARFQRVYICRRLVREC